MNARFVSDATIGLSDGLTVPFALTAGLSAFGSSNVVIFGGLAELLAGCISMGLGGYLGAKSEAESYKISQRAVTERYHQDPVQTSKQIQEACVSAELPPALLDTLVQHIQDSESRAVRFLTKFHEDIEETSFEPRSAYVSAATIAAGYFLGGFIPLFPYFFMHKINEALFVSIAIMAVALFVFGFFKTRIVGQTNTLKCVLNGIQMIALGGAAAAVAVGCVKLGSKLEGTIHSDPK